MIWVSWPRSNTTASDNYSLSNGSRLTLCGAIMKTRRRWDYFWIHSCFWCVRKCRLIWELRKQTRFLKKLRFWAHHLRLSRRSLKVLWSDLRLRRSRDPSQIQVKRSTVRRLPCPPWWKSIRRTEHSLWMAASIVCPTLWMWSILMQAAAPERPSSKPWSNRVLTSSKMVSKWTKF